MVRYGYIVGYYELTDGDIEFSIVFLDESEYQYKGIETINEIESEHVIILGDADTFSAWKEEQES